MIDFLRNVIIFGALIFFGALVLKAITDAFRE
jgi:hypothetical protein